MKTLITYCASSCVHKRLMESFKVQRQVNPAILDGEFALRIDTRGGNGAGYSLAAARNRCMDYATERGFDLLLLCDADTVIESLCVTDLLPDYGVAVVTGYNERPGYHPSSWLALRRPVFERFRFHEGYDSLFWQDIDFDQVVTRGVPKFALWSEFRCRHLPHPIATGDPGTAQKFEEGSRLYYQRLASLMSGGSG